MHTDLKHIMQADPLPDASRPADAPRRLRQRLAGLMLSLLIVPLAAGAEEHIGLVHPLHELTLSMGTGGVVGSLPVAPGKRVKANQVLLVLDDRMQSIEVNRRKVMLDDQSELRATEERVAALKSMVATTRSVFERTGSISRDEMTRVEIEYGSTRARLEQLHAQKQRERFEYEGARQELQMRRLTAPVAGVITRVDAKVGEWAKPGEPLMTLVDASTCYLKINVPLKAVHGLRVGSLLPVVFEAAARVAPVQGKVSFISSVADPSSGLVELRIDFANPGLRIRPGVKGMINLTASGPAH